MPNNNCQTRAGRLYYSKS